MEKLDHPSSRRHMARKSEKNVPIQSIKRFIASLAATTVGFFFRVNSNVDFETVRSEELLPTTFLFTKESIFSWNKKKMEKSQEKW